ncbi:MAG TPA: hypothetical protein VOA41_18605 [Candidatus Dormibacteraeota bacterium]|nr:hypothetical protein [Candidatus Dormibacteraeota bacterium]
MIRVLILAFFCLLSSASSIRATTIPAANCLQPVVQAAVLLAVVADTVTIPAGNCTWSTPVTVSKGVTLQGAGQDVTVINASGTDFLLISGNGGAFRLTGMGFTGNITNGAIQADGRFSSFRMDHLKFTNLTGRSVIIGYNNTPTANPAIFGLIDHITYTNNACFPFGLHHGKDVEAWTGNDNWGTNQAVYIEDSTFTWNVSAAQLGECTLWDQEHGGRAVIRHNTIKNGTIQGHDTGSTQQSRGLRIKEMYSNTFICNLVGGTSNCGYSAMDFRGGSYLVYDNSIPLCVGGCTSGPAGWENANSTEIWRVSGTPGASEPWNFKCTSGTPLPIASDFRSHCNASPFPACGLNERVGQACSASTCPGGGCGTCVNNPTNVPAGVTVLSRIDGTGAGNYPCRDQVGRGIDSADHTTQALTPAYWWNNTDANGGNAQIMKLNVAPGETTYIQANRDVYLANTSFNGTAGVGRGPLSARPNTCTPLVGYWATDTNTLYTCTSTDTWSAYYKAFAYPHPLQTGTSAPAPPRNLRVTVQ